MLVEPTEETGKNESAFSGQKFLVRQRSIIIYTNFNLIAEYLSRFLKKRGYPSEKIAWKEVSSGSLRTLIAMACPITKNTSMALIRSIPILIMTGYQITRK